MTLPSFSDVSVFEETCISSSITVEDAPAFFDQHGIFYHADAAIGRKATELGAHGLEETDSLQEFEIKDQVSVMASYSSMVLTLYSDSRRSLSSTSHNSHTALLVVEDPIML